MLPSLLPPSRYVAKLQYVRDVDADTTPRMGWSELYSFIPCRTFCRLCLLLLLPDMLFA